MSNGKWWKDNIIPLLTLLTVIGGFIWTYFQLCTMKKNLYSNSILKFQEYWTEPRLEESRAIVHMMEKVTVEDFDPKDKKITDECRALRRLCAFYEFMGWHVFKKYIAFEDIRSLYGTSLNYYWNKCEKAIREFRKKYKEPAIYEHFEDFAILYKISKSKKEEGGKIGIKEAFKEGLRKGKIETARELIKLGVDINIIAKATGFSKKETEKLRSDTH